ncbi:hypothetical protein PHYSODRAFT_303235 [Phytophthora sojae]|uniref:Uncharacterized protein n=1 Tax=Phytophthora sojae (strain P6497) TaxID=1094619 RepID=G4ZRN5_PHYSP|nr:hypothetical protein PHYSODRAFT_303235 [Phytophthora sojae]EGZ13844.1 hypothetical protein PHYSODRAFT_303235 [Phytophthora sojae]|eukprot:XP_009531273.1 hypothetical protein PHYSODRAFT_303235 [Phytophthora sojae]
MLQTVFELRPYFLHDCLRCLAKIACSVGNTAILDWVSQFGIELRSTQPIREAVSRGDVKLLQWFFENEFEVTNPKLLELAVQGSQLEVVRWLSTHGYTVNSLALTRIAGEEMYSRYTDTPVLRWVVENGPPLDLPTATALVLEYRHIEIAWWASEDIRKHLVLKALETDDRRVVWWNLARTHFQDEGTQQSIREAIQCCQGYTKQWFEKNMREVVGCSWYFLTSIHQALRGVR